MGLELSVMEREGGERSPEICHFPALLTAPLSPRYTSPNPAVYLGCKKQGAIHYSQLPGRVIN